MTGTNKKNRHQGMYPVIYMFVMTFVVSGALIGFSRLTADRVETNKQAFYEKAIMAALNWQGVDSMSPAEIHSVFTNYVAMPTPETGGAYRLVADGRLVAYALPFEGDGFWNRIKGVVGLTPDGKTLTGIAFYEQKETPGLGAEIVKRAFTEPFKGHTLLDGTTPVFFEKGGVVSDDRVQAITGATQTCTRLEAMLNDALVAWLNRGET